MPRQRKTQTTLGEGETLVAQTGITYFRKDIMKRIQAGERVPHNERGEPLRIEAGEQLTPEQADTLGPSLKWLREQGHVTTLSEEEDDD